MRYDFIYEISDYCDLEEIFFELLTLILITFKKL